MQTHSGVARRVCPWIRTSVSSTRLLAHALAWLLVGCATQQRSSSLPAPRYTLRVEQVAQLNTPGGTRFDASGLLLMPSGELLTLHDKRPTLYRIDVRPGTNAFNLTPLPDCFTSKQLAHLAAEKTGAYDSEGIAVDEKGRLYICEESQRWILRCDRKAGTVERLPIDWKEVEDYFSKYDTNASFEGIAIGQGNLYVANERSSPVIVVVDLQTMKVIDHFVVYPRKTSLLGMHYSDLCWFEGKLWVLLRQHRVVLQVDPKSHDVLAEFDYEDLESALGYQRHFPVGIMEGLAVDRESIWLVTDNNGMERAGHPRDIRPTLVKCRRPDRK